MLNGFIGIVVGSIAPLITAFITRLGLTGIGALWASYAISVALAVLVTFATGEVNWANVSVTVATLTATSQTIFNIIKDRNK